MKSAAGTRRATALRKQALVDDLRAASRAAGVSSDAIMLSVRELSAKYDLSVSTISLEVQKLAEEGVLYTVPRIGTFVGRPRSARQNLFLAVLPSLSNNANTTAICSGFEQRVARLGGTSLVLDAETARGYLQQKEELSLSGVLEVRSLNSEPVFQTINLARVEFGELAAVSPNTDAVYFDNVDGGRQATQHLLALGHRKIAFAGLHGTQDEPGIFVWSKLRETGWRQAMNEAGASTEGLSFCPRFTAHPDGQRDTAAAVIGQLLDRGEFTAVVVVNAFVARGMFEELRARTWPLEIWPATVSFDSEYLQMPGDGSPIVTALRQPWELVGHEAANLLWERSQGLLTGLPQQRLVPMTLIPRLSCRQEWHRAPAAATNFAPPQQACV